MSDHQPWQNAPKGEVSNRVMDYVSAVEQNQSGIFERFVQLDYLYDPNAYGDAFDARNMFMDQMSENVVASNVDTVTAIITASEIRPRLLTDDADWSVQRNAQAMSWYAEGLAKLLDIHEKCVRGFHGGALKGVGLNKVFINSFDEICIEPTLVDDIVVDEKETRAGKPRQLHQRMLVDREVLKAEFPQHESEIEKAQKGSGRDWEHWAGYRPVGSEEVVCVESWHLPIGRKGKKGYKPGRHTWVIDGFDLVDEVWEKDYFPFARFAWTERTRGFYALGLAERIVGHQRELNRLNWTEGRILQKLALPTTWVRPADQNIAVRTQSALGTVAVSKADVYPKTESPNPLSPQILERRREVKGSSFEESGVSRLAASAKKPTGIDSGVGLREFRDQTSDRFSRQDKGFERYVLDTIWLALMCAKELGENAPTVVRQGRYGAKTLRWQDIEGDEIRIQLAAASTLGRTPAGRTELVLSMAEGGVISQDKAYSLLMPNSSLDVEHEISLYAQAKDDVDASIEEILDGGFVVPEPYQNAKMAVWRGQMSYLKASRGGAPETILETLRQWITQSAWIVSESQMMPQNANVAAPMGADPAMAETLPQSDPMALAAQVTG